MMLSQLEAVLDAQGLLVERRGDVDVIDVTRDSRRVAKDFLFSALPGERRDGARFVAMAEERGAAAVLVQPENADATQLPALVTSDARKAMAHVAHAVHGQPTERMRVVGLTGTNGKTTVSFLVEGVLRALHKKTALLGTVQQRILLETRRTFFTTPESDDLARFAREAADAGAEFLVMEASSHGLELSRVSGVQFEIAGFTNLTQDHLDFHPTMEAYGAAKAKLFLDYAPRVSVINIDDAFGRQLATRVLDKGLGVIATTRDGATVPEGALALSATDLTMNATGLSATVETPEGTLLLESPLVGGHNLENLLVTLGVLHALDIPLGDALKVIRDGIDTPGRLERVPDGRGVTVLVDYAHTPDALANAIRAVRAVTEGRLFIVFGCGGDRDRDKRPLMGEAAAAADVVIVTSDNPRTEDPQAIIDAIVPAVEAAGKPVGDAAHVLPDRREAIEFAVKSAAKGDSILIAGKGHEDYQIIGEERIPFDDREVARRAIASLGGNR